MADFVSLTQIKNVLGITDTSDDVRLQAILNGVLEKAESMVGNIYKEDKTEKILKTQRIVKDGFLPLSIINPTQIKSIDGVDFTGKTEGSDYLLLANGTAQVKDLSTYITTDFDYFSVTYEAGYATAPNDYIGAIATLVGLEFSTDMGKDTTEETTGPRTVRYSDTSAKSRKNAYSVLKKYIPIHLRMY